MSTGRKGTRGAAAGLFLTAAGMLYSRLGGRRGSRSAAPQPQASAPAPLDDEPADAAVPSDEVERARAELSEELARRAARADA